MAASVAFAPETATADTLPAASQPVASLPISSSAPEASSTPAAADLPAVDAALEDELRRALRDGVSRSAPAPRSLVRPAAGAVTGPYRERRRSGRHPGIDFDGTTGDPVVAAGAGTVVHAGQAPEGYSGYGRMVLIDHGGGVQTLYAHLSKVAVAVGTSVRAGDNIGAVGASGAVTGSHLHFEVRLAGQIVDPRPWLSGS